LKKAREKAQKVFQQILKKEEEDKEKKTKKMKRSVSAFNLLWVCEEREWWMKK